MRLPIRDGGFGWYAEDDGWNGTAIEMDKGRVEKGTQDI